MIYTKILDWGELGQLQVNWDSERGKVGQKHYFNVGYSLHYL